MINDQLHPLEANPLTGEPFLRLKHHRNIILTPPRPSDTTCYPPILNDPRVYEQLIGPPIPFLPGGHFYSVRHPQKQMGITQNAEHAEAFFAKAKVSSDAVFTKLSTSKDIEIPETVGHCPINAIREVSEGEEDIFLGDISLRRCTDVRLLTAITDSDSLPGDQGGARQAEENASRVIGDPQIIWTIGCMSMRHCCALRVYLSVGQATLPRAITARES